MVPENGAGVPAVAAGSGGQVERVGETIEGFLTYPGDIAFGADPVIEIKPDYPSVHREATDNDFTPLEDRAHLRANLRTIALTGITALEGYALAEIIPHVSDEQTIVAVTAAAGLGLLAALVSRRRFIYAFIQRTLQRDENPPVQNNQAHRADIIPNPNYRED
jgi:hypothetical protein